VSEGALSAERPFPGLRPFDFDDHAFFFGREEQSYALYDLLELSQFVAVVGSSGSGKSSLVRAGLRPLLRRESDEAAERDGAGGRAWRWIELRPGDTPMSRLAARLADLSAIPDEPPLGRAARRERLAYVLRRSSFGLTEALAGIDALAGRRPLIVVDQFEELFRYEAWGPARPAMHEEAAQFVQLLLEASSGRNPDVHVLITMRSDFIGDCARFYGLPEAVSACQFLVPGLTRDQREAVIRQPLEAAEATIEPALVERLLNDIGGEFDQLPVLQHCLLRLWDAAAPSAPEPPRRRLTLANYEKVGGLAHALSWHADKVMAELPGDELAVEQVFRALSELDRENRATRRALPFAQLRDESGIDEVVLRRVLKRFRDEDCAFLVPPPAAAPEITAATRLDVGHEALLRRWDKISAPPVENLKGGRREGGWLWREDRDGQICQALLALREGGSTLPLDQVKARWAWWNERPRTAAWVARYDGDIERVRRLFADSRAAMVRRRIRLGVTVMLALLTPPTLLAAIWAGFVWWGVREVENELLFVRLGGGDSPCFEMGSPVDDPERFPNEGPVHQVCPKPFELSRFEVTQSQWRRVFVFYDPAPSYFTGDSSLPVDSISWDDVHLFVRLMSLFGRSQYRLPSEAEWEYAARAGTTTSRYWGNDVDQACTHENVADLTFKSAYPYTAIAGANLVANCDDHYAGTSPVGTFNPNPWGLYDMLGNLGEWVEDCYADTYDSAPRDGSAVEFPGCSERVLRGASWYGFVRHVRAAIRFPYAPTNRDNIYGFRLARTIAP